jgi:glycosyltransferase involved in cell wall biosynthesis
VGDLLAGTSLVAFGGYEQGISGAERMAWSSAKWMYRLGQQVVVLTDSRAGYTAKTMPVPVFGSPAELRARQPGFSPSIVHAFDLARPELVAAAAGVAAASGVPFVLTPASHPRVWPDPLLGCTLARQADLICTLTDAEQAQMRRVGVTANRMWAIPQASDLQGTADPGRFRHRFSINGPIVLFLGRRLAVKGFRVTLEASRLVWQRRPDAEFVFAGPGDAAADAALSSYRDPRVHDVRSVDEQTKHDALAACTVLCLPTTADVFPLVFIEAWSCGKPVISGNFPGSAQVVRNEVDGLVVAPEPKKVADALVALLGDDGRRAAMGEAGQLRVRAENSWRRVAERYLEGYAHAMRARDLRAGGATA